MKVRESNIVNPSNSANVPARQNRAAAPPVGGSTGLPDRGLQGSDHVQVSTLSHRLSTLDLHSASHASRLTELSSDVSEGRYHVDAQVVSNKLIQEHMRTAA
jgi:hypothetical protein